VDHVAPPPRQRWTIQQGHAADVVRRALRTVLDMAPPDEADEPR
jgi:hypothetical protein